MNRKQLKEIERVNGEATWIILQNPERYVGLPLLWAQSWMAHHGEPRMPSERIYPTFEERLEEEEANHRQSLLKSRRRRWRKREWSVSAKGNPYVKVKGILVVVFSQGSNWNVGIADGDADMIFSKHAYKTIDEAKENAFDYLLIAESRRSADPAVLASWRVA